MELRKSSAAFFNQKNCNYLSACVSACWRESVCVCVWQKKSGLCGYKCVWDILWHKGCESVLKRKCVWRLANEEWDSVWVCVCVILSIWQKGAWVLFSNILVVWFRQSKYGRLLYACCRYCVARTIYNKDSAVATKTSNDAIARNGIRNLNNTVNIRFSYLKIKN